jgi:hypothetical protein
MEWCGCAEPNIKVMEEARQSVGRRRCDLPAER